MYFSPQPKTSPLDYFNYEKEQSQFHAYLSDPLVKMIVVKGLRRTGKTSFVRVALAKSKRKHIAIDARSLIMPTRQAFEAKVLEEFKKSDWLPKRLLDAIQSVEYGLKVGVSTANGLWEYLEKEEIVLFVDEVQALKGSGTDALLAAIYDGTRVKLVLSGSEIGVLNHFIGANDAKVPLFGRTYREIELRRLEPEKSLQFLNEGFAQAGKQPPENELSSAINSLDGVIGWLAAYGNEAMGTDHATALKKTIDTGRRLALAEFEEFLTFRKTARVRYTLVMEAVCNGNSSWSSIRNYAALKLNEKAPIPDSQLANILTALADYGFIVKENEKYRPADPVIQQAWKQ